MGKFRDELFKLCNILKETDDSHKISQLIYNMTIVKPDETESNFMQKNAYEDFAMIAKDNNLDFFGYLFLDENIENIKLPSPLSAKHLSNEERILLCNGHKTIMKFVDMCISDVEKRSKPIADILKPYSNYKNIEVCKESRPIIDDHELYKVVNAFKQGKIYKSLMNTQFELLFDNVDKKDIAICINSFEKEINNNLKDGGPEDLKQYALNLEMRNNNLPDIMLAYILAIIALRESINLSCKLIYRAICGEDLIVLNDDNIINIEKRSSSFLREYNVVLAQGIFSSISSHNMGSILLMDCNPQYEGHVHVFGVIVATTISMVSEFGETEKFSFVTLDDELNYIYPLTNELIRVGFPKPKFIKKY